MQYTVGRPHAMVLNVLNGDMHIVSKSGMNRRAIAVYVDLIFGLNACCKCEEACDMNDWST